MKTKILTLLTVLTFSALQTFAQNQSTINVKSTLEAYIAAGDNNNIEQLKPHLHENFRVVLYDNAKDTTSILDRSTYVSFIATKKFGGYKRRIDYQDIQLIDQYMASVKVTLTSPGKPTLKNFYSLVKIKNKWLVIQDYVVLIP